MTRHHFLGFAILVAAFLAGVSSLPTHNEFILPDSGKEVKESETPKEERSLTYNENSGEDNVNAREIIDKIKLVNDGLVTPKKRQPVKFNPQPHTGNGLVIDNQILEKIQAIIAAGKLNPLSFNQKQEQEGNSINNEDAFSSRYSKNIQFTTPQYPMGNQINQESAITPYIMNLPVMIIPLANNMATYNSDPNSLTANTLYQTRQRPSLPFNIPWPLAPFFPILIRDPLLNFIGGGSWNNLIDYGQSADVCNRKQKAVDGNEIAEESENDVMKLYTDDDVVPTVTSSRRARAIRKRQIHTKSLENNLETLTKVKKLLNKQTTKKPSKQNYVEETEQTKNDDAMEGDLRFPFGDFSWFGNKKPVAPSPGFFINKLKVRRGGVAIAGPGGVATAGRGGAAIVGPGGLAYTQPGGLAVAGPSARIIALSSDADLSSIVSRLQEQSENSSVPRSISQLLEAVPEGKVVATGPIIYYHPKDQTASVQYLPFYGGAKGQYLEIKKDNSGSVTSEKIVPEEKISSENIIKNRNENLLSKVLAANLASLRSTSLNLLKLHNLGRRVGFLSNSEKARFKEQLASLEETASNTVKIIDDIGGDIDMLFKSNVTQRKYEDYDYVEDTGVGIEAPTDSDPTIPLQGSTIAEAKPVGLAVIGENGLASSRPVATAIASHGVALARPIATAVAGVDPQSLGLNYQLDHTRH